MKERGITNLPAKQFDENIAFKFSEHDEIIVTIKDVKLARELFEKVLAKHFKYFQLK